MRHILKIFIFFWAGQIQAQSQYNFDSLTTVICKTFQNTSSIPDTLRIQKTFEKHYLLFEGKTEIEIQDIYGVLYLRLQMNCSDFDRISEIGNSNESDGITIHKDQKSKLKPYECSTLFSQKKYYYLEGPSKVDVIITDSIWKSLYPDGTYSLLTLKKNNSCEFIITFVESNNFIISNVFKKGHKFRYKIIEEMPNYFSLISEDVSTKKMQLFQLFK